MLHCLMPAPFRKKALAADWHVQGLGKPKAFEDLLHLRRKCEELLRSMRASASSWLPLSRMFTEVKAGGKKSTRTSRPIPSWAWNSAIGLHILLDGFHRRWNQCGPPARASQNGLPLYFLEWKLSRSSTNGTSAEQEDQHQEAHNAQHAQPTRFKARLGMLFNMSKV